MGTLRDIYGVSKNLYCITLTPKGKGKTHEELLGEWEEEIKKLKCVVSWWLIAEKTGTNHFHGMIQTTSPCQFYMFNKSNKSTVHALIEEYKPHFNQAWYIYCMEEHPTVYYYKMATPRVAHIYV